MTDDLFDFGFSAVTEDELDSVQKMKKEHEKIKKELKGVDSKAERIYNAVLPLLDNLRRDPEKDYIYWPNREEKIDDFEARLSAILDGDE